MNQSEEERLLRVCTSTHAQGIARFNRDLVCEIQQALSEVNAMPVEEWEAAFRRGSNPAAELDYWLGVARRYTQFVTHDMPLEARKNGLHRILAG